MKFTKEKIDISRIVYKSGGKKLEGLIFKPKGEGRFPGVIFIHGHKSDCWNSSMFGYRLAKNGFSAFLPSQLGYGLSDGKPDFCGPKTVQGVIEGIKIFLGEKFVDKDRIGIWGISRGAIVSSLIAVKKPEIFKLAVFQSGAYEMKSNYKTTKIKGIKTVFKKEAGTSTKAFKERSSIYDMDKINFPVLILHGENDNRISVKQAKMLDDKLIGFKKKHKTIIFPLDHYLTKTSINKYTLPFLNNLKKI